MKFRVDEITNQRGAKAFLLRTSFREGRRVRHRTVANLTPLPRDVIGGLRVLLGGGAAFDPAAAAGVSIRRSLPHGHVAAALAVCRRLGLGRILSRRRDRVADLALAAAVARVLEPASKLATARALSPETATTSLGAMLGLGPVSGNETLAMLDWLRARQPWIEASLARRHLTGGTLILYDVTSSWLEGRRCPLAAFGHSRDGKRGKMQITFGLLCAPDGCPVAVEVFAGNASDPETVPAQVARIRDRFGIRPGRIALVGDRGMVTDARIREDLEPAGMGWIGALRKNGIRRLMESAPPDAPVAAVEDAVAEVSSPAFPGERLMACLNPRRREESRRKREDLLQATEETLRRIEAAASAARPGKANRDRTSRRIGREANRRKVEKHFRIEVREDGMSWSRDEGRIAAEAALDGICVVRTSLPADAIGSDEAVTAYKSLSRVERAFRTLKQSRLEVRPVYVYSAEHVRGHVFLCMLACHIEWHMRRDLAPMLFEDEDAASRTRASPVQKAEPSASAKAKAAARRTRDGLPVHSFDTLLADLATLTLNTVQVPGAPDSTFDAAAKPTPVQARALELLGADPAALPRRKAAPGGGGSRM